MTKTISYSRRKRAEEVVKTFEEEMLELNSRLRKKWKDWYTIYRFFENQQKLPGQSNIFIPKIYEIIEKKAPALVAEDPKFLVTPRQNQAIEYLPQVRDTLNFWWESEEMKRKNRLEKWVKDGLIYGTAVGKIGWKQKWKTEKTTLNEVDPVTNEPVNTTLEEQVLVEERPTFETASIFDVLTDPRCETFGESVGNMHIIDNVRLADLLEDKEIYDLSRIYKDKDNLAEGSDDKYTPQEKGSEQQIMGVDEWRGDIDKGTVTLKEYWGRFSPTGKVTDEDEYVITAVWQGGKLIDIIRLEKNPYGFRPFVKFSDHIIQGEFYGIGEIEPLEGLQIEYNNLRNARVDFNNAVNYPEWIYNLNAGINPSSLVHRPNNMIGVELPIGTDINTVLRTVEKPVQPQSGYAEEAQMNRDFQTISQTIDYTDQGGSQGFENSATGIKSRDAERGIQVSNVVRHLENAISEVGEMWLRLADYFVDDELTIRRKRTQQDVKPGQPPLEEVPQKFTTIKADVFKDIVDNYTIHIEAGSTTAYSAVGRAEDAVNVGNTTAQFIGLGVPIDVTKVFLDILRDAYHKANPESYIKQEQSAPVQGQQSQRQEQPQGKSLMLPQGGNSGEIAMPQGMKVPMQPSLTAQ